MEALEGTAEALTAVVGVVLVLLGATGATLVQRRLDAEGRSAIALLALVPFGVLIGAGAALARGWDLPVALVVGALLVPVVGAAGRLLEVRRRRRRRRRGSAGPDDLSGG